jgi:hypothetical protein
MKVFGENFLMLLFAMMLVSCIPLIIVGLISCVTWDFSLVQEIFVDKYLSQAAFVAYRSSVLASFIIGLGFAAHDKKN